MDAIPPVDRTLPTQAIRPVRRRLDDGGNGKEQRRDRQADEQEPEQTGDDGLPHVDVRV
jgi:hypothetical protein